MTTMAMTFFGILLSDHFLFVQYYGLGPFWDMPERSKKIFPLTMTLTSVLLLTCIVVYPIRACVLEPMGLGYLDLMVTVLVIVLLVQFSTAFWEKYSPIKSEHFPWIVSRLNVSACILACVLSVSQDTAVSIAEIGFANAYFMALAEAAGAGCAFGIALWLFRQVEFRLNEANPPVCFQGLPLRLLAAAITALPFFGLAGVMERMLY